MMIHPCAPPFSHGPVLAGPLPCSFRCSRCGEEMTGAQLSAAFFVATAPLRWRQAIRDAFDLRRAAGPARAANAS